MIFKDFSSAKQLHQNNNNCVKNIKYKNIATKEIIHYPAINVQFEAISPTRFYI